MDEGGELLAGNGRRQRHGEEGGEAGVVLVELGGGVAGRHGSAKGRVRIEERVSSGGARGGGGDVRDRGKERNVREGRWDRGRWLRARALLLAARARSQGGGERER